MGEDTTLKRMIIIIFSIVLSILLLFSISSCSKNKLTGTIAYVPKVTIGNSALEITAQTLCWSSEVCMSVVPGRDYKLDDTMPTPLLVKKSNEKINIEFYDKPEPISIIARIEEVPNFYERGPYIGIPQDPGTYTYNILVYWEGEKAMTQGLANYRFKVIVE